MNRIVVGSLLILFVRSLLGQVLNTQRNALRHTTTYNFLDMQETDKLRSEQIALSTVHIINLMKRRTERIDFLKTEIYNLKIDMK